MSLFVLTWVLLVVYLGWLVYLVVILFTWFTCNVLSWSFCLSLVLWFDCWFILILDWFALLMGGYLGFDFFVVVPLYGDCPVDCCYYLLVCLVHWFGLYYCFGLGVWQAVVSVFGVLFGSLGLMVVWTDACILIGCVRFWIVFGFWLCLGFPLFWLIICFDVCWVLLGFVMGGFGWTCFVGCMYVICLLLGLIGIIHVFYGLLLRCWIVGDWWFGLLVPLIDLC